ncbi:hypothetical protein MXZ34_07705 [Streptococcus uberis]|uniref:hypothetical protein n=1 Tax=Streptococcus uberis TaxID=1349 RepID=UPI001FF5FF39|nr:hypothetical protein [Streptococcus uberis]MCK1167708.1 hypothetical protein [Streptococcus uberis]
MIEYKSTKEIYKEIQEKMELNKEKKFSLFIKSLRKKNKYGIQNAIDISTNDLADLLGIGRATFRKILSGNKLNQPRDCIIAICSGLGLTLEETNNSLLLYEYSPLIRVNCRDQIIESIICQSKENKRISTYSNLVESLKLQNLPEIKIRNIENKSSNSNNMTIESIIIDDGLLNLIENEYSYFNSMGMEYHPINLKIIGQMTIKDNESGTKYSLYYDNKDKLFQVPENNEIDPKILNPYFRQLRSLTNMKYYESLSVLNDTKNYGIRSSAKFINGKLIIFSETYFTHIPGKNYYCFCQFFDNDYTITVSNKSKFLSFYLENSTIDSNVSNFLNEENKDFYEKLISDFSNEKENKILNKKISTASESLKIQCQKVLESLREKTSFINNYKNLISNDFDDEYFIMKKFNLLEEFSAQEIAVIDEGDYQESTFIPTIEKITIDKGEGPITLTINELSRAYELGIETIDDVYLYLINNKSIENILYN